jgi:hypothetical protein
MVSAVLAAFVAGSARGQQSTVRSAPSTLLGSVAGYVVDAETNLPVRFAEIHLVPKPADTAPTPEKELPVTPASSSHKSEPRVQAVIGSSGMDGSFRIDGVPVGDYLAAAIKPGYVVLDPALAMDPDISEEKLKSVIASLPEVHVAVGQVPSVNLTLHRGAAISGRVQFADGSPAIGVGVACEPVESIIEKVLGRPELRLKTQSPRQQALQSLNSAGGRSQFLTDDQGRYRIFALPPGKCIVSTGVVLSNSSARVVMEDGSNYLPSGREQQIPEAIVVYQPAAFSRKDAKVFDVHGEEQITAADIQIDPNGLHSLRGKVFAVEDRHALTTGMVRLREKGAQEFGRIVQIEEDGSFQMNYLPSGSYTIVVQAFDAIPTDSASELKPSPRYKVVKLPVLLGDHDVVLDDVLLPRLKPGEESDDFLIFGIDQ